MQLTDWFVLGFLGVALAERLIERRYSQRAIRGECRAEWTYTALHLGYSLVFLVAAIEYFLRDSSLHLGVTGCGLLLFVIALIIRLLAIRALGRFWSLHLEIREDHQLVTTGIYQYMRHPAYSAIVLEILAVPLVLNVYLTMMLVVVAYVPLILLRWSREEKEMIGKFGQEYERYRKQVPAFVPWRWGKQPVKSSRIEAETKSSSSSHRSQ